jgi:hypothetical protein
MPLSMRARVTETAATSSCCLKVADHSKLCLDNRHQNILGDTLTGLNGKG